MDVLLIFSSPKVTYYLVPSCNATPTKNSAQHRHPSYHDPPIHRQTPESYRRSALQREHSTKPPNISCSDWCYHTPFSRPKRSFKCIWHRWNPPLGRSAHSNEWKKVIASVILSIIIQGRNPSNTLPHVRYGWHSTSSTVRMRDVCGVTMTTYLIGHRAPKSSIAIQQVLRALP